MDLDLCDIFVAQVVEEKSAENVVEKVRMVLAGSSTVGHKIDLANHRLDRSNAAISRRTPV